MQIKTLSINSILFFLMFIVVTVALSGCKFAGVDNPFTKGNNRHIVAEYDKKVVGPANAAWDGFHKEYSAFVKVNKDKRMHNPKRAELANKYYAKVEALKLETLNGDVNPDLQRERACGNELVQSIRGYLKANGQIVAKDAKVRNNAWRENALFYHRHFDKVLEYEHFKSLAMMKDETYTITDTRSRWLKSGHNYFNFAGSFKMPGKLLYSEKILYKGKPVSQEVYLWSLRDSFVVVTFYNGEAVNIQKEAVW